ncbi:hypothetical protein GCM10023091_21530 [Ravibacter arvi]|uniref:Uncharacterized protein n=1 Tax=Ravibacter arvi TaxID=2051041 RepID=A0ABP8M0Y7_9BACT
MRAFFTRVFLLSLVNLTIVITGIKASNDEVRAIKEKVRKNKLYDVPLKYYEVSYPYAFLAVNENDPKKEAKILKILKRKSGFKWTIIKWWSRYLTIVPEILVGEYELSGNYQKGELAEEIGTSPGRKYSKISFRPRYEEAVCRKYGVSQKDFDEFVLFQQLQNQARYPFASYKNMAEFSSEHRKIPIEPRKMVSEKGYPYYGKVSVKMLDEKKRQVGAFGYVYDKDVQVKPWGEEHTREYWSNVSTSTTTVTYEVSCDKKPVGVFQNEVNSVSESFEGNLAGSILWTLAAEGIKRSNIRGYEDELFRMTLIKACYYEGDSTHRDAAHAMEKYKKARKEYESGNFFLAFQYSEESLWLRENAESYELRADIYRHFNYLLESISDYLTAIEIRKRKGDPLTDLYRKIAISMGGLEFQSLKDSRDFYFERHKTLATISPDMALAYIRKADPALADQMRTLSPKEQALKIAALK